MKIDLLGIRRSYNMNPAEFASLIGLKRAFYLNYEKREELPSKYVYKLWKQLKNFPLPDDFFYFTSFTLQVNMKYHHMTQSEAAKMFNIAGQSTLSAYLQENIPMYEKKEEFLKFDPFIVPFEVTNPSQRKTRELTDLIPKGNFVISEKKLKYRKSKAE